MRYMSRVLTKLAASLGDHSAVILPPPEELIIAALKLRKQRLDDYQAEVRHRTMGSAIAIAADAFRARFFDRVVAELKPYEDILPPAQRAKLDLAQRRSTGA